MRYLDLFTWVIQSGMDGVIAITNELLGTHKTLADDITGTTQPEALIGLEIDSDEYIAAAVRMRRASAQRIADALLIHCVNTSKR